MAGFKIRTQDTLANYGPMPDIDIRRFIAVYIRQSKKDADDKNGESRKTQLELKNYASALAGEKGAGVREYDEGSGMSGQKRIDEREQLNRLYKDMDANLISAVIVSREDRLFRDKWGIQSGTFMELAEKRKVVVIVPPLSINGKLRFYDFSNYEHIKAFKDRMQTAYDYVETHIRYMNVNQKNKGMRGNYDGRWLPPGLMVPYGQEKMEQKIDVYQPWASVVESLYSKWEEYDYSLPKLARYVESLPYLFKDIPEEDVKKYCFRTSIDHVSGGFKPKTAITLKSWFMNVAYVGWWLISQESGEVIINNHPAIIERERFERGYIELTGCTLEGIPVNNAYPHKRHQARRDKEESPEALLQFVLSSPVAPWLSVCTVFNRYKKEVRKELYYKGHTKDNGDIYNKNVFCIRCDAIDEIVVRRLEELADTDKLLASRIEASLEDVRVRQVKECVSIDDQITQIDINLVRLTARLATVSSLLDDDNEEDAENEVVTAIVSKVQALRGQKRELEKKKKDMGMIKGNEELRNFYTTLGNVKEEWHKLKIDKKQKLIKLLTTKVEFTPCSMHWYKLTIHWIGPVCNRPDIAYIWRKRPESQPAIEPWELDLIKEHYANCDMEELLRKMPNRTWRAIIGAASGLGVQREGRAKREIPVSIAWEDIAFFPDKDKVLAMAREAIESDMPLYAKWIINLSDLLEHEGDINIHSNNDRIASATYRYA